MTDIASWMALCKQHISNVSAMDDSSARSRQSYEPVCWYLGLLSYEPVWWYSPMHPCGPSMCAPSTVNVAQMGVGAEVVQFVK